MIFFYYYYLKGIFYFIVLFDGRISGESLEYSCDFNTANTSCSPLLSGDPSSKLISVSNEIVSDPFYYRITDVTSISKNS